MDSAKKQHERFLLDRFLELRRISPSSIKPLDPPDFLIDLEGRKVGIEVTELFIRRNKSEEPPQPKREPLLQAVESITNLIVCKAREIYFAADNPHVCATIWFSDQITLDKTRVDQLAKDIANQIQSMNLQNPQVFRWSSSEAEIDHPLSESVFLIHAQGVPDRRFAHWTVARPGVVAPLTRKHLQEAINEKAKKISVYKEKAGTEEVWLLIFVDRTRPSQMLSVAPGFPLDSVSSPFTKTFYCGYVTKEVIDLPTKSKPAQ
jgi:hypothetical protein